MDHFYDYQFSVYFLLTRLKHSTVLTCSQFHVTRRIASLYRLIHVICLCSGEHTDADPLSHRLRRVGRHVQCETLHPSPEVRHDPSGAECVRSLRGYLRAPALHSGMSCPCLFLILQVEPKHYYFRIKVQIFVKL